MLKSLILLFVHLISLCCPVLFQARPIDSLNRTSYNFIIIRACSSLLSMVRPTKGVLESPEHPTLATPLDIAVLPSALSGSPHCFFISRARRFYYVFIMLGGARGRENHQLRAPPNIKNTSVHMARETINNY